MSVVIGSGVTPEEARDLLGTHFISLEQSLAVPSEDLVPGTIRDSYRRIPFARERLVVAKNNHMVLFPAPGLYGTGTLQGEDVRPGWYAVSRLPLFTSEGHPYASQLALLPRRISVPSALLLQHLGGIWRRLYNEPFSTWVLRSFSEGGAITVSFTNARTPTLQRFPPQLAYDSVGLAHCLSLG